jgi:membrane protein implicated in regulation of membrane protease activity
MGFIRLLGSIIWAVALGILCYQISEGTNLERWNLDNLTWLDVIGMLAIIGFIQSSVALRFFFGMLKNESNTEYYDVYKDSYGREIKREANGDAKMSGCFFTFFVGLFLSILLSAILGPIFFLIHVGTFIWYLLIETRFRWLLFFLIPLLVAGVAFGSYKAYHIIDKHVTAVERAKQKKLSEEMSAASLRQRKPVVVNVQCGKCNGSGSVTTQISCHRCYGLGVKKIRQRNSRRMIEVPCKSCNGSKYRSRQSRCWECMGKGHVTERRY